MRILTLPFRMFAWLVGLVFSITGRFIGVIIGLLLLAVGMGLTATILLAIIGIPLMIVGFLLILKSLFG